MNRPRQVLASGIAAVAALALASCASQPPAIPTVGESTFDQLDLAPSSLLVSLAQVSDDLDTGLGSVRRVDVAYDPTSAATVVIRLVMREGADAQDPGVEDLRPVVAAVASLADAGVDLWYLEAVTSLGQYRSLTEAAIGIGIPESAISDAGDLVLTASTLAGFAS